MPSNDYWAAISQLVPLVALALVVEARAITKAWTLETVRLARVFQTMFWAITLVALILVEGIALSALRGKEPSTYWVVIAEYAIGIALSSLIISPLIDFLIKANAESVGKLAVLSPILRYRYWRMRKTVERVERKTRKTFDQTITTVWNRLALMAEFDTQALAVRRDLFNLDMQDAHLSAEDLRFRDEAIVYLQRGDAMRDLLYQLRRRVLLYQSRQIASIAAMRLEIAEKRAATLATMAEHGQQVAQNIMLTQIDVQQDVAVLHRAQDGLNKLTAKSSRVASANARPAPERERR